MSNKYHRYEAVVKLKSGPFVTYHNINTGLVKFHQFVKNKYSDKWVFWKVRRISNKEIVGTFYNNVTSQIKAVRVCVPKQRNERNSGFFIRLSFRRNNITINRNLFFSDKVVLEYTEDCIVINEIVFKKGVEKAINDLHKYYEEQGHLLSTGEIILDGDVKIDRLLINKELKEGTEPENNYP